MRGRERIDHDEGNGRGARRHVDDDDEHVVGAGCRRRVGEREHLDEHHHEQREREYVDVDEHQRGQHEHVDEHRIELVR
jgi:hypothetical protein